jgi:hypothetical protein
MRAYVYRFLTLIFLLGFLAVLAGYVQMLRRPAVDVATRPVLPWTPAADSVDGALPPEPGETAFGQTFQRPLFSPTRKPFQPSTPPVEETEVAEPVEQIAVEQPETFDPQQFQLKGVLTSDSVQTALIATPEKPDGSWLRVGSGVMGWTVRKIEKNTATLELAGKTVVLKQYVDNLQQ